MQYLVLCNAAMATSFASEVSLLAEPVLSFRMFSADISVSQHIFALFFWEKEIVICLK